MTDKIAAGKFSITTLVRPGLTQSDDENLALIHELRTVAASCFCEVPDYQALVPHPRALDNKVLSLARNSGGELVAFCSSIILQVPKVGDVFHTGLTCVAPVARSSGLTHTLMHNAILKFMFSGNPFRTLWITNVACVLSSLGNIAAFIEDVYPSPYGPATPTLEQQAIAHYINRYCRDDIAIQPSALFDEQAFVFSGSVPDTVFQKDADDTRYTHRNRMLNDYYRELLDFTSGDEVCQIGYVNLASALKHLLRRKPKLTAPQPPARTTRFVPDTEKVPAAA